LHGETVISPIAATFGTRAANAYAVESFRLDGVRRIQNVTGLGTTARGITFSSGAALQIQGGISVGNETLTLSGGGIANDVALRNISGTNSLSRAITLASDTTFGSDAGTLTLSGVISGSFALTKIGVGALTLSNANTFSGGLTLNAGTVSISSDANLGASSGSLTFGGGTLQATNNVVGSRSEKEPECAME
jgi:fibronectin-binding autotransporter adhesin